MTVRIEFNCDARNCKEHHVVLVDESCVPEMQQHMFMLLELGWHFTKGQRPSKARSTALRVTCPKHAGTKR